MGNCVSNTSNDIITSNPLNTIDMYRPLPIVIFKSENDLTKNNFTSQPIPSSKVSKSNFSTSTSFSEKPSCLLSHTHTKIEAIEEIVELNEKEKELTIANLSTEEKLNAKLKIKNKKYHKEHSKHENSNFNHIKIIIFGDAGVGKSAFTIKMIENHFERIYVPTLGKEIMSKMFSAGNDRYYLTFYVTTGDHNYKEDYSFLLSQSDFIFIFYDTSIKDGFKKAKKTLFTEVSQHIKNYNHLHSNVIFVGNKTDIHPRRVPKEEVDDFCKGKFNFDNFDISVKNNSGIKELIEAVIFKHLVLMDKIKK